jgi:hypothetical protein
MITGMDYYRTGETDDEAPIGPFSADELHFRDDGGNLKQYWVHGPGLKKWANSPHPWTALYRHILKHVGSPGKAKRIASQWFHDHFGYWPGHRKGKNPVGKG